MSGEGKGGADGAMTNLSKVRWGKREMGNGKSKLRWDYLLTDDFALMMEELFVYLSCAQRAHGDMFEFSRYTITSRDRTM